MTLDATGINELLRLAAQYIVPVSVLVRALYSGLRGRVPQGFREIIGAGLFSGAVAALTGEAPDLRQIILDLLGNAFFTAGILSFAFLYLLRTPDRGPVFDGIIGAGLGLAAYLFLVFVLGETLPWYLIPALLAGGAAAFIVLRFAKKQITRAMRVARALLIVSVVIAIGAGAVWLLQNLTQGTGL